MKPGLLVVALTLIAATPAFAQSFPGEINLRWRGCITVTSGPNFSSQNVNSACDGTVVGFPGNTYWAVVSFIAPPNVTNFIGTKATLEAYTPWPTLPDYWRHGAGECRETSVSAGLTSGLGTGATGSCQDPYLGAVTTREWTSASERPCVDRATITVQLTRDSGRPLTAGQHYLANAVIFDTNHADYTNADACAGCPVPALLKVTKLEIIQASPLPTIVLIGSKWPGYNYIFWEGGVLESPSPCYEPVPTRSQTWGAIKATYR